MENAILTHRRSRTRVLVANLATMVLMGFFLYFLASIFEFRGPPLWICVGLLAFNLAMFGHSTWKVYNQTHDFVCTLHRDRISCQCPDDTMGATFDLPLSQVREIRRESGMEGSSKYVLVMDDGKEYWLTGNFGNPAAALARELRKICPDATWRET